MIKNNNELIGFVELCNGEMDIRFSTLSFKGRYGYEDLEKAVNDLWRFPVAGFFCSSSLDFPEEYGGWKGNPRFWVNLLMDAIQKKRDEWLSNKTIPTWEVE